MIWPSQSCVVEAAVQAGHQTCMMYKWAATGLRPFIFAPFLIPVCSSALRTWNWLHQEIHVSLSKEFWKPKPYSMAGSVGLRYMCTTFIYYLIWIIHVNITLCFIETLTDWKCMLRFLFQELHWVGNSGQNLPCLFSTNAGCGRWRESEALPLKKGRTVSLDFISYTRMQFLILNHCKLSF